MRLAALVALALVIAVPVARAEALIGDTLAPFSADRTVVYRGKTYVGRVYAVPGRQRHEIVIEGLHLVAILRADRKVADVMLPALHVYAEFPFPKSVTEYGSADQLGPPEKSATLAGQQAAGYRVDRPGSDGSLLDGWLWRTDDGIVVKAEGGFTPAGGKRTPGALALSNVRRGPQPAGLFELPPGMARLDVAALEPLFNLRLPTH